MATAPKLVRRPALPLAACAAFGFFGTLGYAATPPRVDAPLPPADRAALAIQVGLDRAGFSPGEIDARMGAFTTRALAAFRTAKGISTTPTASTTSTAIDPDTERALGAPYTEPLVKYTITEADVAGPFLDRIPQDMMEQAKLKALGYTSALEELAERFHISPNLLTRLNPHVPIAAGSAIMVPAVEPFKPPSKTGQRPKADAQAQGTKVELSKESGAIVVRDAAGAVLMYAPVTMGSEQDPLPVGDWKVTGVIELPVFNYNPNLFWDAEPSHAKAKIAAGPNSPVGVVWIQINKEHFGLHGTREPSRIGRTESHGCVRLTNWDAVRLASLVEEGTPVILR
jgi:lipoprotein-anchoring transpeptidase ErfK/SrfK